MMYLTSSTLGRSKTPLASAEIQDRWRNAPDRSESSGEGLMIWPVQSHAECRQLLATIRETIHLTGRLKLSFRLCDH